MALAAAAVALALLPAVSAARPPRAFFGIQAWGAPAQGEFNRMAQAGVGTYRLNLVWPAVEPTPGKRNWAGYDALFVQAARARLRVLPVFLGSPRFAASQPQYPPRKGAPRKAFGRFVHDAVARYGRGGTFWRSHRELRALPPTAWQVWNEPNFRGYWNGHPSARQYVAFLRLARKSIKSADRRARIILAGLPETKLGIPLSRYLAQIYRVRGARRLFNAVAVHPYARNQRGVLGAVIRARLIMRRHRDGRKPIVLTEVGWATGGQVSGNTRAFKTSLKGQSKRLKATFGLVSRIRRRYGIGLIVWFAWRDRARVRGERDWWAIHTGLFTLDGQPKPAWQTFAGVAGGSAGRGALGASPQGGTGGGPGAGGGPTAGQPPGNPNCLLQPVLGC